MVAQVLPPLPDDARKQLVYISGFNVDGTVAAQTAATYDAGTGTYNATDSSAFKWGGGQADANGNPGGPNPTAGTPGGTIRYWFNGTFSPAEKATYVAAMKAWENVANVQFVAGASAAAADFTFNRNTSGQAFQTSDPSPQSTIGATTVFAQIKPTISIDMTPGAGFGDWANNFSDGGNSYNTAVHELGHLLGLGHGGPYNEGEGTGGGGAPAKQYTIYDQTPYTIMSYVVPSDTNARLYAQYVLRADYGTSPAGTPYQAVTPQILDILAIQRIYGAATGGTLTQAQTFGFNTTITDATKTFFDFSINMKPVVTIYSSAASGNVLDLSGFSQASVVKLAPGSFGSVAGLANNLGIAYGTTIGKVIGGAGADTITGFTGNETLQGGGANDTLDGGGGNDTLDGGSGDDSLIGGLGNDLFIVDSAGDRVSETAGQGTDTVQSSVTFLLAGAYVENLTLTGNAAINGTGNSLANLLVGNGAANVLNGGESNGVSGNDTLDGGAGADTLTGGTGDDTYLVDNAGDRVVENAGGGTDTVLSSITFALAGIFVENLTLTGNAAINGTGNSLANLLVGNGAANVLDGGESNGVSGNDTLDGGLGADTLIGRQGADLFRFSTALGAGNIDTITSFNVADDTIALSAAIFGLPIGGLAADAYRDVGVASRDADDRILYNSFTGKLYLDADGSGAIAAIQFATLANMPANLSAADFLIV